MRSYPLTLAALQAAVGPHYRVRRGKVAEIVIEAITGDRVPDDVVALVSDWCGPTISVRVAEEAR